MRTAVSAPITHNKQARRSASEWRALLRAFAQSGMTRTQFCEHHGLSLSTFAWWRSHLRRESTAVSQTTPAPASALFVELAQAEQTVAAVSANWDVELELGSGVFLRLRRGAC
jgi:putative transposase